MPSARPRNSENVPSVAIRGGIRRRVTSNPFRPPAAAPSATATAAAAPMGSPPSRQHLPRTTAVRPIRDPTDRSIPPETITGVSATASRPISTLSRRTSKPFATERKLVPTAAKATTSAARIAASTARPPPGPQRRPDNASRASDDATSPPSPLERIGGDRQQDRQPLDRLLPLRL